MIWWLMAPCPACRQGNLYERARAKRGELGILERAANGRIGASGQVPVGTVGDKRTKQTCIGSKSQP